MLIVSVDHGEVQELKWVMSSEFDMNDLGEAKRILGIKIDRDKRRCQSNISQGSYVHKVLERFGMETTKPVLTPTAAHMKLSVQQSPKDEVEEEYMSVVRYLTWR